MTPSNDDIAIRVQGLGKLYRIGQRDGYKTLRESMMGWLRPGPRAEPRAEASNDFWALKDVNFEVKRGEVVGIIGRNGAGKSTLLKVLSRITEPTEGRVEITGRVGSLLEVGTGFHPELTGRENVFLNGAILGMREGEIRRKFDEIVAFAEIEQFIDTPVKRYSSGMYTRLAFAVAAHLEPEILIVDEVLAVGDAQFQKKCLGRMSAVASEGRTVLFVSHDMGAVRSICRTGVMLGNGQVRRIGAAQDVVDEYMSAGIRRDEAKLPENATSRLDQVDVREARGDGDGPASSTIPLDADVEIEVQYTLKRPLETGVSIRVSDHRGYVLFDCHECIGRGPTRPAGAYTSRFRFDALPLAPGRYMVSVYLMVHGGPQHLLADPCVDFEIVGALSTGDGSVRAFDIGGVLHIRPDVLTRARGGVAAATAV